MKEIIRKFYEKNPLNTHELKTLKWYIIQWIDSAKLEVISLSEKLDIEYTEKMCDLSKKIIRLNQNELYHFIAEDLLDFGIDPF